MIKLTRDKMSNAIERAKQLHPRVWHLVGRSYAVQSANNANVYIVSFEVNEQGRFAECECKAALNGRYCYHVAAAAAVNIGIQSMRRHALGH